MMPSVATVVYVLGILALFVLDRDRNSRTSAALWIPVVWLWIAGSRAVSLWLQMTPPIDSPDQYLEGSPIDRAILSGLLATAIVVLCLRRRQVGRLLRANLPIVLFFLYCAASALWSDYPDVTFKRCVKGLGDFVMVMIVLTDHDRSTAFKRVLTRTAFLLIPLSILFIKYYPALGRSYSVWTWTPFYSGVTTNKNTLGMICLLFGLASVWRLLDACQNQVGRERARRVIAHTVLIAMVLWLFWMANSMTSLVCFLLASGLIIATSLRVLVRKPALVHLLVAVVVLVCFSALFLDAGSGALESLGRDPTLTGRTKIWNVVLKLSGNPLLGTGYESFWLGERLHRVWSIDRNINQAHNGYLELFLNLGWIGVTLFAALVVGGYRNVVAAFRRNPGAGRIGLAFFVVAIVYDFTEAAFRMMSPLWIFFLMAATATPERAASIKSRRAVPLQAFSTQVDPHLEQA